MKKNMKAMMAAVAIGAGVVAAPMARAQTVDAGLARQQQLEQERKQKQEQQAANRTEQQAAKAERREAKREREELSNMPKPVRQTLRAETLNAQNVDYYRVEGQGGKAAAGREFGAKFTAANGHQMDIRVDREGKVLTRDDLTAAAAAQAPATAAQQPAPATPAPATPAPAPGSATASTEAPESGNPIYRRLQATDVPQNIRTIFDKDTTNAKDVRYYRTKYGSQLAYEAKWTDPNGKDMRHYVSDAGATLVRGESNDDDDNATTASAKSGATNAIKTGRAELNDLPKPVQTYFRRSTEGAKDVKYYNTKYGSQQAYRADFTSADGKDHAIILDQNGKVLSQKTDAGEKK